MRLVGVGVSGFDRSAVQERLFDDELNKKHATSPLLAHAEEKAALLDAKDLIAEKFGDHSLRFGHEIASRERTTRSSSNNPTEYLDR